MSDNLTAEEVRAKYVSAMPEPLGEVFYELQNELTWLHIKWKDFLRLFGTDQETVDLLNEAAPAFAHNLQRMMWEDVLLHLCRLTDRSRLAGKDTLTILRIAELIPDSETRERVEALVGESVKKVAFARKWRNRRLAHRELPPNAGGNAKALAPGSRAQVEAALASIGNTLNTVERRYMNSTVAYEHSIPSLGGVESLLSCLRDGVEVRRAELERLRGGCGERVDC